MREEKTDGYLPILPLFIGTRVQAKGLILNDGNSVLPSLVFVLSKTSLSCIPTLAILHNITVRTSYQAQLVKNTTCQQTEKISLL